MAGRKPLGPALVQHLEGSTRAKERWEVILETLTGRCSVAEACTRLNVGEAMFHNLRNAALQAGLHRLEPRPLGRPRHEPTAAAQRIVELETQLAAAEQACRTAEVRWEVAHILAAPPTVDEVKKTTAPKPRRSSRRPRRKKPS